MQNLSQRNVVALVLGAVVLHALIFYVAAPLLNLNTESVVSGSATFVAILALGLALWEAHQARVHNRLTVRPHVEVKNSVARSMKFVGSRLHNNGLGPAIITQVIICLDGKQFGLATADAWIKLLDLFEIGTRPEVTFENYDRPEMLAAGESRALLLSDADLSDAEIVEFAKSFGRLSFVVTYESLYGESFKCVSERLLTEMGATSALR